MPVLGHAAVGLAIAMSAAPSVTGSRQAPHVRPRSALWLPAIVGLAYLPDMVTEVTQLAGWGDGRLLGHSVLFAVATSPVIAMLLWRLTGVSLVRGFLTSVVSLVIHDLLDLAQATDRAPWWPLSSRRVGVDLALIPMDLVSEAVAFGALTVAFLVLRHVRRRGAWGRPTVGAYRGRSAALVGAMIATIVIIAAVTHALRDVRESELERARALVERHAYQSGLEALVGAERWPSTARPGRIDYLRAEAHAGLGDRTAAEMYYVRANRADPGYFWAAADLALFYASASQQVAERRRLVAPHLGRLQNEFAGHPALPEVLARVEGRLSASPAGVADDTPRSPE